MKRIKLDFHSAHSIVTKSIHSKNVKGKNMCHEDIGDLFLKRKYDKFLLAYQTLSGLENMI